jgi:hypothetical protein
MRDGHVVESKMPGYKARRYGEPSEIGFFTSLLAR